MSVRALLLACLLTACGTAKQASGPKETLRRYIAAIESDDSKTAHTLLSESMRKQMTHTEFAERWKSLKPELRAQATQLQARLDQPIDVTAELTYAGGTRARLRYVDNAWRIEEGVSMAFETATPADALRTFMRAVQQRSYEAVMKLLARSVRRSIEADVEDRLNKLKAWLAKENEIEVTGNRARARYDARYKIELVNEDGQWKVLDFD